MKNTIQKAPQLCQATSASGKFWQLRPRSDAISFKLAQEKGISINLARILTSRGLGVDAVDDYLNPTLKSTLPDPYHLLDMEKATLRIEQAIQHQKKIGILGDYDVDGATSTALLARYLEAMGTPFTVHIPDRIEEGYGPNAAAFSKFKQQESCDLAITLDCGTTAFEALEASKRMNLDVIVIDHHAAEPLLPEAFAVVNPNRLDQDQSPVRHLAAVGVTFLFLVSVTRHLRQAGYFKNRPEPNLLSLLDLVALGTVCDVVPLTGLNRAFVTQGLKVIKRRGNIGIKALCDQASIDQVPSAYHLGFVLGPRINAGGRVGEASLGAELLLTSDSGKAEQIATRLSIFNQERKHLEQQALNEAEHQVQAKLDLNPECKCVVVASKGWHPGVIGIVAGRLKDKFHRPSFVIAFDHAQEGSSVGKGSARSMPELDIGALIQSAKQKGLLLSGGGHAMAGGISIREETLAAFTSFCEERIFSQKIAFKPILKIDEQIDITGATVDFVRQLDQLAPFGQGNPTPKILLQNLHVVKTEVVGESHLRCTFVSVGGGKSLQGICFRALGTPLGDLLEGAHNTSIDCVVSLKLDQWMGREKLNVIIEDVARSGTFLFDQQDRANHKSAA